MNCFKIQNNYRSTPQICAAAQRLIEHQQNRPKKVLRPVRPEHNQDVDIEELDDAAHEARFIASFSHVRDEPNTVAVLARTNFIVDQLAANLETLGIKVRKRQANRDALPQTWPMMKRLMALACNPENDQLAYEFIKLAMGKQEADKQALAAASAGISVNQAGLKMSTDLDPIGFIALLRKSNFDASASVVSEIASKLPRGASLQDLALAIHEKEQATQEIGEGVTVTTVHSFKGREAATVFVCGLEEEVWPGRIQDVADLHEERRVLYVAMTRARDRLILTHVRNRQPGAWSRRPSPMTPSRFLKEIEL